MKLISHECPIWLFQASLRFNDYDYCLVHLLDEHPEYYRFFKGVAPAHGRRVIMDNSIFELGEAFDGDEYAKHILDIRPSEVIIPDVLGDWEGTLTKAEEWVGTRDDIASELDPVLIGVVHGTTIAEALTCYTRLWSYVDKVAIPSFDPFSEKLGGHADKRVSQMLGRQRFIDILVKSGTIRADKPHHLLGCALPQEFAYYRPRRYDFIESIDTSNPVLHGLKGILYDEDGAGLFQKAEGLMADMMDMEEPERESPNRMFVASNIIDFRRIVLGHVSTGWASSVNHSILDDIRTWEDDAYNAVYDAVAANKQVEVPIV